MLYSKLGTFGGTEDFSIGHCAEAGTELGQVKSPQDRRDIHSHLVGRFIKHLMGMFLCEALRASEGNPSSQLLK